MENLGGRRGWYEINPRISIDEHGELTSILTPQEQQEAADEEEGEDADEVHVRRAQRMKGVYRAQFLPVRLDAECSELPSGPGGKGPLYLLVHGVEGDGVEWWPVIPTLERAHPARQFMYRWMPNAQRGELVDGLVKGVNRLTACFPEASPIVLLAHSAGGVISSFAASRLQLQPGQQLHLLTVASPLAGVGYRKGGEDDDETRLINDLGTAQTQYPAAAPHVHVTHFRTQYPADAVMKPNMFGHPPNKRGVGVAGAREVDLPETLGHDPSLLYVAKELVAGRALSP